MSSELRVSEGLRGETELGSLMGKPLPPTIKLCRFFLKYQIKKAIVRRRAPPIPTTHPTMISTWLLLLLLDFFPAWEKTSVQRTYHGRTMSQKPQGAEMDGKPWMYPSLLGSGFLFDIKDSMSIFSIHFLTRQLPATEATLNHDKISF